MPEAAAATPLLEQYEGVKARYPGHLVLFRVGDFYETFGEDARLLARELEVALTARAPDREGARTPMAGVPHHAVDSYLGRLVQKGYKVALCDQLEDARLAKGLVRRDVTRVVTPGTALEERILPGPDHNFLASAFLGHGAPGRFAVVDVTTGEWFRGSAELPGADGLASALAPFAPREILLGGASEEAVDGATRSLRRAFPAARLERRSSSARPEELPEGLATLGGSEGIEADLQLVEFVRIAQPRLLPFVELPREGRGTRHLVLDAKSLRHLEIARPMNPDDPRGATLLGTWDATRTAPGRRTLALWLTHPLADPPTIHLRQEAVGWLVERGADLAGWRRPLDRIGDVARLSARIAGRRVRPDELAALPAAIEAAGELRRRLLDLPSRPEELARLAEAIDPLEELLERLRRALPEATGEPGRSAPRFRPGFDAALDAALAEEAHALAELQELERGEQEASGIRTLRIGYNQVFGYYFEVSRPNLAKVPAHFRRRQTVAGGERFTSDRLEEVERRLRAARDGVESLSDALWERLLAEVDRSVPRLYRLARAVGEFDALSSLAETAQRFGLVRPEVDGSRSLTLREGRHPVLDRRLAGAFVPNDAELDADGVRLLVLTGPNMSGKSTYMRQLGLLVVLAQAGSFVPARFFRLGVVSRLYTRMGFTDEIGRGKSSFMVEMSEVAEILHGADERALVLLDEVGRGTSTFDGLALAWATLRDLHDRVRCRTMLATHYHQLTELVEGLDGARNAHLAVREGPDGVVFLHRLVPGSTDRSLGIHVARLAGLPAPLLAEAERLLKRLETEGLPVGTGTGRRPSGPRYTQALLLADEPSHELRRLAEELAALDPERMTPIGALAWLVEARRRLGPSTTPSREA